MADPRHRQAMDRFTVAANAEHDQRERELEDLAFVDAEQQWPEEIKNSRAGKQEGTALPVAARPCITVNKLDAPIAQLTNQQRNSRLAIEIHPVSNGANEETADVLQGLIRHIEVESRANLARGWAFDRAVKAGKGAYRILKQYSPERVETGPDGTPQGFPMDQELVIKRILNQASVYLDPFATEPDWSDGEWCFITEDLPFERYQRTHPDSDLAKLDPEGLSSLGDESPGWVGGSDEARTVRIAEYWYIETEARTLLLLSDDSLAWQDTWQSEARDHQGRFRTPVTVVGQREVQQRHVKWCKINALEILEEQDWDGQYIPIIPVLGKEAQVVDGERRFTGLVRSSRGAQQTYNFMLSAQVEAIALSPKAPFMIDPEQIEGFELYWQALNTRNMPYLPRRSYHASGRPFLPIERNVAEPPIQAISLALNQAGDDIHTTTGIPPAALGDLDPHERSGRAILALQRQGAQGTSVYLDNLSNISMVYEAKVLLDLIPHVYDRPGRVARILGVDDEPQTVMLNQPFVQTPQGPQPVPTPVPGAPVTGPAMAAASPKVQQFDLSTGKYAVTVSTGQSYQNRLMEGADKIGQVLQAAPGLLPMVGDIYFKYQDFPGHLEIADRLHADGVKRGLIPDKKQQGEPELPPAVQQRMAQMDQFAQMAQQQLEQLTQERNGKVLELQSRERIAAMDNRARIAVAEIAAGTKVQTEAIKADLDRLGTLVQAAHEDRLAAREDIHENRTLRHQQAHELGMAALTAAQTGQQADQEAGLARVAAQEAAEQTEAQAQRDAERQAGAGVPEEVA
jgi:hypothetical protein